MSGVQGSQGSETDAKNDSGEPQIEVTSEMIEAGAMALTCFDWLECDPKAAAKEVFTAMLEASCNPRSLR